MSLIKKIKHKSKVHHDDHSKEHLLPDHKNKYHKHKSHNEIKSDNKYQPEIFDIHITPDNFSPQIKRQ